MLKLQSFTAVLTLGLQLTIIFIVNRSVDYLSISWLIVVCFKMSENGEKCWSVFSKASDDVLKCLVIFTPQRYSIYCHSGVKWLCGVFNIYISECCKIKFNQLDNTLLKVKSNIWEDFGAFTDCQSNVVRHFTAFRKFKKALAFDSSQLGSSSLWIHIDSCWNTGAAPKHN